MAINGRGTEPQPKDQHSGQDVSPAGIRSPKENRDPRRGETNRTPGYRAKPTGW